MPVVRKMIPYWSSPRMLAQSVVTDKGDHHADDGVKEQGCQHFADSATGMRNGDMAWLWAA